MDLGTLHRTFVALRGRELDNLPVSVCDQGVLGLTSWRGVYSDLAVDFGELPTAAIERGVRYRTVSEFRDELEEALAGKVFHGYKGGDYRMRPSTPVWASPWGEAWHNAITGVYLGVDCINMATINIEEYT